MQEFSSISVSSYEPGSLADQLNEKAGDGWSVVSIVPTGSTITAYLSREASGAAASSTSSHADTASTSEPAPVEHVNPAPAASSWGSETATAAASEPDTGLSIGGSEAGMGATPEAIEPIDEPGGWAVSPEPASSGQSTSSEPASASPSLPSSDDSASATSSSYEGGATSASSYGGGSDAGAQTTAASTAASSAGSAPAGWYADPSSRYELRYWDGSQWTEHVSRAGQQFTDPPVA